MSGTRVKGSYRPERRNLSQRACSVESAGIDPTGRVIPQSRSGAGSLSTGRSCIKRYSTFSLARCQRRRQCTSSRTGRCLPFSFVLQLFPAEVASDTSGRGRPEPKLAEDANRRRGLAKRCQASRHGNEPARAREESNAVRLSDLQELTPRAGSCAASYDGRMVRPHLRPDR